MYTEKAPSFFWTLTMAVGAASNMVLPGVPAVEG